MNQSFGRPDATFRDRTSLGGREQLQLSVWRRARQAGRGRARRRADGLAHKLRTSRKTVVGVKVDQGFETLPLGLSRDPLASDTLDLYARGVCCM